MAKYEATFKVKVPIDTADLCQDPLWKAHLDAKYEQKAADKDKEEWLAEEMAREYFPDFTTEATLENIKRVRR